MSIHKIMHKVDGKSVACGCEYTVHRNGAEEISKVCQEHELEFIVQRAAAVASCSHVNHDLIG